MRIHVPEAFVGLCLFAGFVLLQSFTVAKPRYGRQACEDIATANCQHELQPHYCYLEHNRRLCCRTCENLRRPRDSECPYGDHHTRIVRNTSSGNATFTCSAYISFYGRQQCTREARFRQLCCESCKA